MRVRERLAAAADALQLSSRGGESGDVRSLLAALEPSPNAAYVIISCMLAEIPRPEQIVVFSRRWRLRGLGRAIAKLGSVPRDVAVRIVAEPVIDLTNTSSSPFTTGIQRVARETSNRWAAEGSIAARWDDDRRLRSLSRDEILIPFNGLVVLPEISTEPGRTARLRTIAMYAHCRTAAIGFDCIPVTTAETAALGMPGAFSAYLASLAVFDVVIPISEASADEFRGWSSMLEGAGIRGPHIETRTLPNSFASGAVPRPEEVVRAELGLGSERVVLAVGSTEPRKNHLRLLAAAELAWRAGHRFTLVMVGGQAWNTAEFDDLMRQLEGSGRSVRRLTRVHDNDLAALYAMARFTVFPSLNEGFGLPIVESIAARTPVITSDYGSMRALAEGFGGRLVDPRDIDAIYHSMVHLLEDDLEIDRLRAEADATPRGSWGDYAADVWAIATDGAVSG